MCVCCVHMYACRGQRLTLNSEQGQVGTVSEGAGRQGLPKTLPFSPNFSFGNVEKDLGTIRVLRKWSQALDSIIPGYSRG